MQALMTQLPAVVVSGIPSISRAVMNRAKGGELQLFAEGFDFRVRNGIGLPSAPFVSVPPQIICSANPCR